MKSSGTRYSTSISKGCSPAVMRFFRRWARRNRIRRQLASVSGLTGWGGSAAYCASKGGIIALTKALAAEYGYQGIRVNCVCPGSVRTPMVLNNLERFADPNARLEETGRLHLLGRVAEPQEIADTILYLLSPQASFITGSAVVVDGGLTAV